MLINGTKFACSTCIKGHRSSHCYHTERPLFEIRKKGRPISQCAYCRDLRKTKQAHIKCARNNSNNWRSKRRVPVLWPRK
ncbi:copper fist DNA binding domain-containing protein, partial [Phycomyces blakesleeanus]